MTRPAFVQSVFDFALREINALETRIVTAEDDADAMLWEQARQVAEQLKAGLSLRKLAAQWINVRTGEPYHFTHVGFVAKTYSSLYNAGPRPRFRDAYNAISNKASATRLAHNSGDFEWYTPPAVVDAARAVLGGIDLDPASCASANTVIQAAQFFTREDDGLAHAWHGRVWLNPPYAYPLIEHFAEKLAASVQAGSVTAAVAIVNNTTETQWFRTLADVATACCFPTGRVSFWKPDIDTDGPTQGQAVIYVGSDVERFRECFGAFGPVWFR